MFKHLAPISAIPSSHSGTSANKRYQTPGVPSLLKYRSRSLSEAVSYC